MSKIPDRIYTGKTVKELCIDKEDVEKRDEIIFGEVQDWKSNSIIKFNDLTVEQINELISEGLINLGISQNDAPTTRGLYNFMKDFRGVIAQGYVESPYRDESNTYLTGLIASGDISYDLAYNFQHFKTADRFVWDYDYLECWWD